MSNQQSSKWYGVAQGKEPGVYTSWGDARTQVDHVSGAVHKSFKSPDAAAAFVDGYSKSSNGPTTPAYTYKGGK